MVLVDMYFTELKRSQILALTTEDSGSSAEKEGQEENKKNGKRDGR